MNFKDEAVSLLQELEFLGDRNIDLKHQFEGAYNLFILFSTHFWKFKGKKILF